MKHDDETLQAAIDAAMIEIGRQDDERIFVACPDEHPISWYRDATIRLALAKAFLAQLPEPEPILADDGRSLGQVAFEAWGNVPEDWHRSLTQNWQISAQAVASAVLAQAIRRMEAVPVDDMDGLDDWRAVRARLIAAAKGEAEQQADKSKNALCEALKHPGVADVEKFHGNADWKAKAEEAEAELAALKSCPIGILRPLAEAMRCVIAISKIEDLVTTDYETKDAFIARVRGILGHNDLDSANTQAALAKLRPFIKP